MNTATVTLPNGLWLNGEHHQDAELKSLTGADEAFLIDNQRTSFPAIWTTELLLRSVKRFGSVDDIKRQTIRSLTIGDREALLLHLRRLTFGETLDCVIICPDCAGKIDPDLKVSRLILRAYNQTDELHETVIRDNGRAYRVEFRLPTGADQEDAALLAKTNLEDATDLILHKCVLTVDTEEGRCHEGIPSAVTRVLPGIMSQLDPQAEITLSLTCPSCGKAFSTIFDTASYFFQELANQSKLLYREIHFLAFYYHWSEAEILSLTAAKRRMYLGLLLEAVTETQKG